MFDPIVPGSVGVQVGEDKDFQGREGSLIGAVWDILLRISPSGKSLEGAGWELAQAGRLTLGAATAKHGTRGFRPNCGIRSETRPSGRSSAAAAWMGR